MTVTHSEIQDLKRELFRDNVYRAERVFNDTQLWLDVGCHVGLFTTLAQAYGAAVIGGVDADPLMVDAYHDEHLLSANVATITTAYDIIKIIDSYGTIGEHVNALKLDIQGSEVEMLQNWRQTRVLAAQFKTLLFEYHDHDSLLACLSSLEANAYTVRFVDEATDALTGQPTYIIHATDVTP
jgi:hypothetical protein